MDVAVEAALLAQQPKGLDHQLGRVVRADQDAGTEKQAFDVVAPVKSQGQVGQLTGRERGPPDVVGAAVEAVGTVEPAVVGQQHLEQGHAAAIFRPGVADAAQGGIADALAVVVPRDTAGRTGHIVTGRLAQNCQFLHQVHPIASPVRACPHYTRRAD